MRVGIGYDIHRLAKGRKLILGGVEVPHSKGLVGHSDGDVLLHAITDAIFGALAMGDIGDHFSDKDPQFKGADSRQFAQYAAKCLKKKKMRIKNIDAVLLAQEPRLATFKAQIKKNIANIFKVNENLIGLKAKTNEGLDAVGELKAIACHAVVLIG